MDDDCREAFEKWIHPYLTHLHPYPDKEIKALYTPTEGCILYDIWQAAWNHPRAEGKPVDNKLESLIAHVILDAVLDCSQENDEYRYYARKVIEAIRPYLHPREAQKESINQELLDKLKLILPMARGYAATHRFGNNQLFIDQAENTISRAEALDGGVDLEAGARAICVNHQLHGESDKGRYWDAAKVCAEAWGLKIKGEA